VLKSSAKLHGTGDSWKEVGEALLAAGVNAEERLAGFDGAADLAMRSKPTAKSMGSLERARRHRRRRRGREYRHRRR